MSMTQNIIRYLFKCLKIQRYNYIYAIIVMSVIEEISKLLRNGSDDTLLNYISENYDQIECELNGEEYKEPKHNRNLCIDSNMKMTIDYQNSHLVCTAVVYASTIRCMWRHTIVQCNH